MCIYINGGGACVSSFLQFKQTPPSSFDIADEDESGKTIILLLPTPLLLSIERKDPLYQTTTNRKERFLASPATETTKMNTTSLVLTGRPAAGLTITLRNPSKPYPQERASLSSSYSYQKTTTTTPTPPNTPTSSPALRPKHLRRISSDSTGWYLDADTPSLQDFEARAQTLVKRFEKFANRCATNVVMGLMSPAAVVLIVFNPIMLVLLGLLIFAMLGGWS